MWALENNSSECVQLLLAAGANPFVLHRINVDQKTLHYSILIYTDKAKILRVLRYLHNLKKEREHFNQAYPYYQNFRIFNYEKEVLTKPDYDLD